MRQVPEWENPRHVLARHGLRPKRSLSQNFIVSKQVVDTIATHAVSHSDQPIVEFGAGVGTLTAALLRAGAKVYAVEYDGKLVEVLKTEFNTYSVKVIQADAAKIDLGTVCQEGQLPIRVAGNLPYHLTGAILKHLVNSYDKVENAVLMVQREVGDRLQASAGSSAYGALTVFTTAKFEISTLLHVAFNCFYPRPDTNSSVLKLTPHVVPRASESQIFRQLVRAAFQARRKTLRNALHLIKDIESSKIDAALAEARIDGNRRGETLCVEEFAQLASLLEQRTD